MSDKEPYDPVPLSLKFPLTEWTTLFVGYSLLDYNLRLLFKTLRWKIDSANIADMYSVDFRPDPLIVDVWQSQPPLREVHRPGRLVVRAAAVRARARRGAGAIAIADEPAVAVPAIPYRGIQPFRYADHAIFFAREEETRLLASLVAVYRGVFLYGDSGNGKSSLINAGLLPQARSSASSAIRVRVQPRAGEELVVERIAIADDEAPQPLAFAAREQRRLARVVLSIDEFEERVREASPTSIGR